MKKCVSYLEYSFKMKTLKNNVSNYNYIIMLYKDVVLLLYQNSIYVTDGNPFYYYKNFAING